MSSKRTTIAFVVAIVAADIVYRLVELRVFALCVAGALAVAVLAQLSVLGVGETPAYQIVIGLALGIVASGVIKYLVFHAFA